MSRCGWLSAAHIWHSASSSAWKWYVRSSGGKQTKHFKTKDMRVNIISLRVGLFLQLTWKQVKVLLLFWVPFNLAGEQVEFGRRSVSLRDEAEGWADRRIGYLSHWTQLQGSKSDMLDITKLTQPINVRAAPPWIQLVVSITDSALLGTMGTTVSWVIWPQVDSCE